MKPNDAARKVIRRERERLGMTQQGLANQVFITSGGNINLHYTAVTRIENGERSISLDEAVAIAKALDLTLAQLIDEEPIDIQNVINANIQEVITLLEQTSSVIYQLRMKNNV